ncbi:MaoC family dehydratase [Paenarthrobacter nitroguajacolicus]
MLQDSIGVKAPLQDRYFEDYEPGLVNFCGSEYVDEKEVLEFGRRFDPQWIHTDMARAASGPFSGVIASGWHTVSLMMKIFVTSYWNQDASLGGLGTDDLRWLSPVRPGDTLSAKFTVIEARRSKSKPDRGIVQVRIEGYRDNGELVVTMITSALARTRAAKTRRATDAVLVQLHS